MSYHKTSFRVITLKLRKRVYCLLFTVYSSPFTVCGYIVLLFFCYSVPQVGDEYWENTKTEGKNHVQSVDLNLKWLTCECNFVKSFIRVYY